MDLQFKNLFLAVKIAFYINAYDDRQLTLRARFFLGRGIKGVVSCSITSMTTTYLLEGIEKYNLIYSWLQNSLKRAVSCFIRNLLGRLPKYSKFTYLNGVDSSTEYLVFLSTVLGCFKT